MKFELGMSLNSVLAVLERNNLTSAPKSLLAMRSAQRGEESRSLMVVALAVWREAGHEGFPHERAGRENLIELATGMVATFSWCAQTEVTARGLQWHLVKRR